MNPCSKLSVFNKKMVIPFTIFFTTLLSTNIFASSHDASFSSLNSNDCSMTTLIKNLPYNKTCKIRDAGFSPFFITNYKNKSIYDHYLVSPKEQKTYKSQEEIYNVINIPESGPELISILVSILALIASVGIPYYQHKKQKTDSINEGFWMREVIMPKVNNLTFEVCNKFKENLSLDPAQFVVKFRDELLPLLGELRDSLYLFSTFPKVQAHIQVLEDICDKFENNVDTNQTFSFEIRNKDISTFHILFIGELMKIHTKID